MLSFFHDKTILHKNSFKKSKTVRDCIAQQYGEAELVKRFFERIWADVAGTEEQAKIHPNFINWLEHINVPEETGRYLVKIVDQGRRGLITKAQFIKFGGEKMAGYFKEPGSARSGGGKASVGGCFDIGFDVVRGRVVLMLGVEVVEVPSTR